MLCIQICCYTGHCRSSTKNSPDSQLGHCLKLGILLTVWSSIYQWYRQVAKILIYVEQKDKYRVLLRMFTERNLSSLNALYWSPQGFNTHVTHLHVLDLIIPNTAHASMSAPLWYTGDLFLLNVCQLMQEMFLSRHFWIFKSVALCPQNSFWSTFVMLQFFELNRVFIPFLISC